MKSKTLLWVGIASFAAATFWAVSTAGVARAEAPATDESSPIPPGNFRQFYEQSPSAQRMGDLPQQAPLDWPAAEMRDVAFARARSVIARYDVMRSRQMLAEQIDRMRRHFEKTPEFTAAQSAEDDAWAALKSAQDSVMARLSGDDEYLALMNLAGEVGRQIADFQPEPIESATVSPIMLDLAGSKLSYARRASAMRATALANDPNVAEARARLQTASAKLRQMRSDFNDRVRDDQTVLAMRADLFENRIANVAAAAYEDTARLTRRLAWDYAWGIERRRTFFNNGFYDPWFWYGNGYGYGGGTVMPVGGGGYGFKRR